MIDRSCCKLEDYDTDDELSKMNHDYHHMSVGIKAVRSSRKSDVKPGTRLSFMSRSKYRIKRRQIYTNAALFHKNKYIHVYIRK